MKPGIYTMPDEEYFALPEMNNSSLKDILRSPAYFKWRQETPREATKAMLTGTALHCAVLEPDEFMKRYAILPDNAPARPTEAMLNAKKPSESSQERVQFWEQFNIMAGGKTIISNEEAAEYLHIGTLIRTHPELSVMFDKGKAEQVIIGKDPETGIMCKCKPDYLTQVGNYKVMIELKSTDDARVNAFMRTVMNFGYFQAAAFYPDVMTWAGLSRPDLYLIVAFEPNPPYGMKIYEVPQEAYEYGQRQYRKALDLYAYCLQNDEWPNYDTEITPLNLPAWVRE